MTPEEFDALFDEFLLSAFRVETLPAYNVGGAEAERRAAWRRLSPIPERSIVTDPWLRRIAETTIAGKKWTRVRIVDEPPTEYQQFQIEYSYPEAQAVGDRTLIVPRSQSGYTGPDFWLFDAVAPPDGGVLAGSFAAVMSYDTDRRWLGARRIVEREQLEALADTLRALIRRAVPLNEYLANTYA